MRYLHRGLTLVILSFVASAAFCQTVDVAQNMAIIAATKKIVKLGTLCDPRPIVKIFGSHVNGADASSCHHPMRSGPLQIHPPLGMAGVENMYLKIGDVSELQLQVGPTCLRMVDIKHQVENILGLQDSAPHVLSAEEMKQGRKIRIHSWETYEGEGPSNGWRQWTLAISKQLALGLSERVDSGCVASIEFTQSLSDDPVPRID